MNNQAANTIYSFDMVEVLSGEILTAYGTYNGPWYRTRLSFYPSKDGTHNIGGRKYRKVSYETGYRVDSCEKLLDLPGEQHFLVSKAQIVEVYRASDAFTAIPHELREICDSFIALLQKSCNIQPNCHGLTGSGLLRCLLPISDFDWLIYRRYEPYFKECILGSGECQPKLTFTREHVYCKYSVFSNLTRHHLDALFLDRWKYFQYRGTPISLSFVDKAVRADALLQTPIRCRRLVVRGRVAECWGCYNMPRIFPIRTENGLLTLFTWLFMYNGAFSDGDVVEVAGVMCQLGSRECILVEDTCDYIRNISAEGRR